MYMHAVYACAPNERTSTEEPPRAVQTLAAVTAAVAVYPRSLAVELRPSVAKLATIERPVRVGEGSG